MLLFAESGFALWGSSRRWVTRKPRPFARSVAHKTLLASFFSAPVSPPSWLPHADSVKAAEEEVPAGFAHCPRQRQGQLPLPSTLRVLCPLLAFGEVRNGTSQNVPSSPETVWVEGGGSFSAEADGPLHVDPKLEVDGRRRGSCREGLGRHKARRRVRLMRAAGAAGGLQGVLQRVARGGLEGQTALSLPGM